MMKNRKKTINLTYFSLLR